MTGRLLGVDYGTVRVGLAVCDAERRIASPLATYERRDAIRDAEYLPQLGCGREGVVGLVIGLPIHNDGREGVKAKEARAYGTWLAATTGLPATYYDERFSTAQAESALWAAGLTHKRRKDGAIA